MSGERQLRSRAVVWISLALVSLFATPGSDAAVIVHQEFRTDGFGSNGMGAMRGETRATFEADRSRTEISSEFSGKFLRRFSGGISPVELVRIDLGKSISVDTKNETYVETSFADLRREREEALARLEESKAERQKPRGEAEPDGAPGGYVFERPKVENSRTGEKDTVAGVAVERVVVTATSKGTHRETGQTCEVVWTMDMWVGRAPGREILEKYYAAFTEALGFSQSEVRVVGQQLMSTLSSYGEGLEQLQKTMREIDGFPFRNGMSLEIDGACGGIMGGGGAPPPTENADDPDEEETGGGRFSRMRKKMMSRMKGGESKNQASDDTTAASASSAPPAGKRKVFGMSVDTTLYEVRDAAPGIFDPPATFKRKNRR